MCLPSFIVISFQEEQSLGHIPSQVRTYERLPNIFQLLTHSMDGFKESDKKWILFFLAHPITKHFSVEVLAPFFFWECLPSPFQ